MFFGIKMKWALPPSYMVGEPVSLLSLWDPQRPEAYQCLHFSGDCLCVSPFMGLDQFLALSVHNSPETKLYSPDYWESFKATEVYAAIRQIYAGMLHILLLKHTL